MCPACLCVRGRAQVQPLSYEQDPTAGLALCPWGFFNLCSVEAVARWGGVASNCEANRRHTAAPAAVGSVHARRMHVDIMPLAKAAVLCCQLPAVWLCVSACGVCTWTPAFALACSICDHASFKTGLWRRETAQYIARRGKGILASDESNMTTGKSLLLFHPGQGLTRRASMQASGWTPSGSPTRSTTGETGESCCVCPALLLAVTAQSAGADAL